MAGEFATDMGVLAGIQELNNRFEWYYGDVEPVNPRPFLNWAHLSEDLWKQRNVENTEWIIRGKLSEAFFGLAPLSMVYTKNEADSKFVTFDDLPSHGRLMIDEPGPHQFIVPTDVVVVYVTGCGGGGGGAGANDDYPYNAGGGGGGGDAVIKKQISVSPGEIVPIYIGVGGSGGSVDNNGAAGGVTSFGSYLTLSGGAGGNSDSGLGGAAGGPGGQDGDKAIDFGGRGGGSIFGTGGQETAGDGKHGTGFGAGGAGGSVEEDDGLYTFFSGGNGAPGFLLIEW